MQIICISRGSQSQGEKFAQKLAAKLGYECVSREQLLEEATRQRIPIGKLETAIIKPHIFTERLALELEHYKALATSILCEKALSHNVVYHGRTGHLLLPGISHILKLRVVLEQESRIQYTMQKLQLPRGKAKRYLEQVDEDRRKWVKTFYNVEWDIFTLYDLVINLSQVSTDNAAAAMCAMAQLPEFQATPASINALWDLSLAAKARLLLATDRRTANMNIKVRVSDRVIYITYLIQQVIDAGIISEILQSLKDAKEIVCTEAQTNILWIQEDYSLDDTSYKEVLSLANTWDAAVELLKLTPDSTQEILPAGDDNIDSPPETWRETGIIDEIEDNKSKVTPGMAKIYENLVKDGRAGGKRTVTGTPKTLVDAIDRSLNYRLVIFDNVFLSKGGSTKKRLIQEWSNLLTDSLKTPVISLEEITKKYKFGTRQLWQLLLFGFLTALVIFLIFSYSPQIITFLADSSSRMRIISSICILIFVPLFALLYGKVAGLFLKMIKLD